MRKEFIIFENLLDEKLKKIKKKNFIKNDFSKFFKETFFLEKIIENKNFNFQKIEIKNDKKINLSQNKIKIIEIDVKKNSNIFFNFENENKEKKENKFSYFFINLKVQKNLNLNILNNFNLENCFVEFFIDVKKSSKINICDLKKKLTFNFLKITSNENNNISFKGFIENKENKLFNQVKIFHNKKESNSDIVSNSFNYKNSFLINDTICDISKNATNVSAHQNLKNINLDTTSKIFSEPILEIKNNEVECSHGCSNYNFLEKEIYFLKSRGFSKEEIESLYKKSFISLCFEKIKNEKFFETEISEIENHFNYT